MQSQDGVPRSAGQIEVYAYSTPKARKRDALKIELKVAEVSMARKVRFQYDCKEHIPGITEI
jgi:hypothetical protein